MNAEPIGYTVDGCVICPNCIDDETERDEETGVFFEAEDIGNNCTCDICHSFLTYDGDWIEHDIHYGQNTDWRGMGIRWATCKECNGKYAFETDNCQYELHRQDSFTGQFTCPNCHGEIHF